MKSEKLKALTFIVVGCIGATALGFTVWQASSPARPTLDIAMHTTTSTTPTPAHHETPGGTTLGEEEPDPKNQVLAAVDTADPYLPPNAYVRPNSSIRLTPPAPQRTLEPTPATPTQVLPEEPLEEQLTTAVTTEHPRPDTDTSEPRPPVTGPSTPATTPPPFTEVPTTPGEESEDSTEPENPDTTTPPTSVTEEPGEDTDEDSSTPTESDEPGITPQPEETPDPGTTEPASPTDFVDEPTAPLNPHFPTATESTPADTTAMMVEPQESLVGAF